jgi:hypothetical protein
VPIHKKPALSCASAMTAASGNVPVAARTKTGLARFFQGDAAPARDAPNANAASSNANATARA